MEEPRDRAQDSRRPAALPNHVRCDGELRCQETQTEKTGNGKLNSFNLDKGKLLSEDDSTSIPNPLDKSEGRNLLNVCVKQGLPRDVRVTLGNKGLPHYMDSMDGNKKTSALQLCDVKPLGGKEPVISLNGDSAHSSGYIANGYSSKAAVDNDGSGSESGYTTPKKRRARRFSIKGSDSGIWEKEKAGQRGVLSYSKQDPEPSGQEVAGKVVNSRPNCTRTCLKPEVHTGVHHTGVTEMTLAGEVQCKNSDTKASGPVSKKTDDKASKAKLSSSVTSKEDSWTLFKPPPVFPVDNSTAKIVPKISYASKVKENLNKAAEAATAQASIKISQVPISAVKMVNSTTFTNGPVSGEANGCPSEGTLFNSAASTAPPASSDMGEENVEYVSDDGCVSSVCPSASEPRKPSLFVYPLKPLNMQTVLPSARHTDAPAAQTNQKALGDIFQNQWGLSFINEPNAGPDGATPSRPAVALQAADITFQGESLPFFGQPGLNPTSAVSLPEPHEAEERTSGAGVASRSHSPSRTTAEGQPRALPEVQKVESRIPEVSRMDMDTEHAVSPLVNTSVGFSKEHACTKGQDRANGCGLCDLQDAVFYHTKEFEYLITLQKQEEIKECNRNGSPSGRDESCTHGDSDFCDELSGGIGTTDKFVRCSKKGIEGVLECHSCTFLERKCGRPWQRGTQEAVCASAVEQGCSEANRKPASSPKR